MYTFKQLEQAEKFSSEVFGFEGFQNTIEKEHLNFWINEIERIETAKRFHDDIEILLDTQSCVYDPYENWEN